MSNTFTEAEFWDLVQGIGEQYDSDARLRSKGVVTALRVAEQISGSERAEFTARLLSYLTDTATRGGPSAHRMHEIERVCGACLILGHWGVAQAVPIISRFLKDTYAMPPLAAIDSLNMLTRKRA